MTKKQLILKIRENILAETVKPELREEINKKFPMEKAPIWKMSISQIEHSFSKWI